MSSRLATCFATPLMLCLGLVGANSARAAWPTDPLVNVPVCTSPGDQTKPLTESVPDGAGGIILAWKDRRGANLDIYAQHVLASGVVDPAWPANGLALCTAAGDQDFPQIASDGAGGAIVTWYDSRLGLNTHIYAQRALASGVVDPSWPANGCAVCLADLGFGGQISPHLVGDGLGGAIVAWEDDRFDGASYIYAQHVRSSGSVDPAWPVDGTQLLSASPYNLGPGLVADGSGGAVIYWTLVAGGNQDVCAQHLRAGGTVDPAWPASGTILCAAAGNQFSVGGLADGLGGAIVVWTDRRGGTNTDDVYLQRVLPTGAVDPAWPVDGRGLCTAANVQFYPSIASDGSGGALVSWQDFRNGSSYAVYAGRVFSNGTPDPGWPANGLAVCSAAETRFDLRPVIAPDGAGGAFISWSDSRISSANTNIYAHRILLTGSVDPLWPVDGAAVCTAPDRQFNPTIVPDGSGGALIGWEDRRSGTNYDMYAQRVRADGLLGSGPSASLVAVPPVIISTLTHSFTPPSPPFQPDYKISDVISIPGAGYTSSGFTASLATGDTVRIRFEAPAGKKFVVHPAANMTSELFFFDTYWLAAGDASSHTDPHALSFENLAGPAPTQSYSFVAIADGAHAILCNKQFAVTSDFEFTAVDIKIVATHAFSVGSQTFGAVRSNSQPSWGVIASVPGGPDGKVMEIRDANVVSVPTGGGSIEGFSLSLATGNPTIGPIGAEFSVGREARVRLSLHDIQGRQVALLREEVLPPGRYQARWDGAGRSGPVPAGVYLLRFVAAGHSMTRRVVVAR